MTRLDEIKSKVAECEPKTFYGYINFDDVKWLIEELEKAQADILDLHVQKGLDLVENKLGIATEAMELALVHALNLSSDFDLLCPDHLKCIRAIGDLLAGALKMVRR